jgi:hypothetical protein
MIELKILSFIFVVIAGLLFWTLHGIDTEIKFEANCFQNGGKILRTNDGLVCIKKDAVLK